MREYMEAGRELSDRRWPSALKAVSGEVADFAFPPENVWLGTSVETQEVEDRIDDLREVPASVRFLSLEPLLGPLPDLDLRGIDWVIVGGESGTGAREMKQEWVVDIRDQCEAANVPFFFKQWGGVNKKENGRDLEGREWNEMPDGVPADVFA
jgi:protein gp37